jgi:bifunctional non-homologous end joining protein LigD
MLLRQRPAPRDEPGWTHELKFDGYRVLADISAGRVRLQTRNGMDATRWFPEVVQSLAALGAGG